MGAPGISRASLILCMAGIYLIGGGASLRGFDFGRLAGKKVLTINSAFKYVRPDIMNWNDPDVYGKNKAAIDAIKCEKYVRREVAIEGAKTYQITHEFHGKDGMTKGIYGGGKANEFCSGITALSLAIALNFSPIYLLGYDGGPIGGELHLHGESRNKDVFSGSVDFYDVFAGYDIINLSPASKIKTFQKRELCEVCA